VRLPSNFDVLRAWELGALCRSVQIAGAIESIVALTVEHANVREQFGRPIGSFQAVRQQIAVMAAHAAAACKAAEYAADRFGEYGGTIAIAAAKARTGEAAGKVAKVAHQVHGAIGITHEHALHQFTRRLWSWRDEYGAETYWQSVIGREIAGGGAENLWRFIAGV
jgi:acyl-CoA dehydrogenase